MHVDARDVPASSILAIVATLALVALFTFSLRAYTRGRLLRSLGTDGWVLLFATFCVIGVLVLVVVLSVEKQAWPATAGSDHLVSLLLWIVTLLRTLCMGSVKLSVALTVLRLDIRAWHRHTILVYICLITFLTVLWFGSALLFAGPITVDWGSINDPESVWRLLGFINSALDLLTTVLVALLPIPLLWTVRVELVVKAILAVVYVIVIAIIAAGSAETYFLSIVWQQENTVDLAPLVVVCSSTELALGVTAASLLALPPFISSIRQSLRTRRASKQLSTSTNSSPPRYHSNTYASTDTVIHRPSAPHLLTPRFHDDESNLDFDIETPDRTRTHTLRSRGTHSRNVSDWSQFSGFTYYTTTAASLPTSPRRSRVTSMNEMEMRTRTLGVGRVADDAHIGIAVTTLHDKPVRDSEAGEEMAELARLFADKSQDWGTGRSRGGPGIEVSRSRHTSSMTERVCASRHTSMNTVRRDSSVQRG